MYHIEHENKIRKENSRTVYERCSWDDYALYEMLIFWESRNKGFFFRRVLTMKLLLCKSRHNKAYNTGNKITWNQTTSTMFDFHTMLICSYAFYWQWNSFFLGGTRLPAKFITNYTLQYPKRLSRDPPVPYEIREISTVLTRTKLQTPVFSYTDSVYFLKAYILTILLNIALKAMRKSPKVSYRYFLSISNYVNYKD
jgi:hypothetical protein